MKVIKFKPVPGSLRQHYFRCLDDNGIIVAWTTSVYPPKVFPTMANACHPTLAVELEKQYLKGFEK